MGIKDSGFDGSQDLIVKVQPTDLKSDPDVFISKINERPTTYDDSEWVCSTYGKDTCSVNHKNITSTDTFFIGVRCYEACQFTIVGSLVKEIELEDGVELQLDFAPLESKLFKFFIPQPKSKDPLQRVKAVTITASAAVPSFSYILLTATTKRDEVPTSASKRGVPGWRKGQVFRISEYNEDEWCTNCWVTILVDITEAGKYNIQAKTNIGIPQIYQDKRVDDVAFFGDQSCYQYYVQNSTSDVQVKVIQYSGLISYYLNPKQIGNKDTAAFKHIGSKNSIFTVTAKERKAINASTGLYYLCIFPHITATYSILISEVPQNLPYNILADGFDYQSELQGNNTTFFVYKTPELDYSYEDISIEFMLVTISGTKPIMIAKQCQEARCTDLIGSKNLNISQDDQTFTKAEIKGNDLDLFIDHDEGKCESLYNNDCYYLIVLIGQSNSTEITKYTLNSMHNQVNFYVLQEGQVVNDYVDGSYYRYYSFTLMEDPKVKNVSFRLNSLHGDADLYVSRKVSNPSQMLNEKSSARASGIMDEVYFDDDKLCTTYYIGVYAFGYSQYSLVALVEREGLQRENLIQLQEGVPMLGNIHNEENHDKYEIHVNQVKGYEKNIKITVTAVKNKVKFFVSTNKNVTNKEFIWTSTSNVLEIDSKDPNFQAKGIYYVAVYPDYKVWAKLTDDWYTYYISYAQKDSHIFLTSLSPLDNQQLPATWSYFRHFVNSYAYDVSVTLTVFKGNPQMYASLDMNQKTPNSSANQLNTRNQSSIGASQGKAILISSQLIALSNNPQCANEGQLSGDYEPCTLYLGVYCPDECKYQISLVYENYLPKQVIVGKPSHGLVRDGSFSYYYLNVRENQMKDIYAVLHSELGDVDLYVSYHSNPHMLFTDQWSLPTQYMYEWKSDKILEQDKVIIKNSDLSACFEDFVEEFEGQDRECALIFGIFAPERLIDLDFFARGGQEPTTPKNGFRKFNFVVFSEIMMLMNHAPVTGQVNEREFQYYLYEASCDECGILIHLSTLGTGNPDLYINYGEERLPTLEDHDIESKQQRSEVIQIDLRQEFFERENIKSLRGWYILGVYGSKNSTYRLTVSQEEIPITTLVEGYSVTKVQQAYDVSYYMFYNIEEEKDFLIHLNVKSGEADLYVSTFNENDDDQNLIERLPASKRKAFWVQENIIPTSNNRDKELLILNQDRGYCEKCYFLLAVVTHEKQADFVLYLHALDANYENAMLMKPGEVYQQSLKADTIKIFKFMIDQKGSFQIVQNLKEGEIYGRLCFSDDFESDQCKRFIKDSETISINDQDPNFQTGRLYYFLVKARVDSEFSLLLLQERTVINLADGVPLKLTFTDIQDTSKYMIYSLPDGTYTLSIQIKTLSERFYPRLYIKYLEDLDKELSGLEFPPGGLPTYFICKNWDYKLGILSYTETFRNVKGGKTGLALNLYDASFDRFQKQNQEVYLTISASSITMLQTNVSYIGTLPFLTSFMIYQVDETLLKKSGYALIEFSQCLGETELQFIESPQKITSVLKDVNTVTFEQYGRKLITVELPRESLYILVKPKVYDAANKLEVGDKTDFMIKVKHNDHKFVKNTDFHLSEEGVLKYDFTQDMNHFNLQWGSLLFTESKGKIRLPDEEQINYIIVASKEKKARLDSICALRKDYSSKMIIAYFESKNNSFEFKNAIAGEKYYLNVFAQVNVSSNDEPEIIPYKPIEIYVPARSTLSRLALYLYVSVAIIFMGIATYYYTRTKTVEKQLEYEMADVRSIANMTDYEKATQIIREENENKYIGINTTMSNE